MSEQLSKSDLARYIAEKHGLTQNQGKEITNDLLDKIVLTLKKGGNASFLGFGSFTVTKRAARNGRNPATGEAIKIKAKKVIRFKAGQDFDNKVNGVKK